MSSHLKGDTSKECHNIGNDNRDSQRRMKNGLFSNSRNEGLPDFAPPKPLQGRHLGFNTLTALPSITSGADALENKKREAEDEIRQGQDQLSEQRKQEDVLRKLLGHANQEEAEERRKHMAEQRDKILSLKKEERRKKVVAEDELQVKSIDPPRGVLRLKTQDEEKSSAQDNNIGSKKNADSMDEKKRSAMRLALARRMKLDLIEGEENKLALLQENQFADLDRKLQQVSVKYVFLPLSCNCIIYVKNQRHRLSI